MEVCRAPACSGLLLKRSKDMRSFGNILIFLSSLNPKNCCDNKTSNKGNDEGDGAYRET